MTTKNFNVKNGLTTGNITLDAATGNLSAFGANIGNVIIGGASNTITGNGYLLSNINGANVSGEVGSANLAWRVTSSSQPNITSVGTLTSLGVTGNITAGNLTGANLVSANFFSGNGALLSAITGSNVSGDVSGANHANIADAANSVAGANVTGTVANATYATSAGVASSANSVAGANVSGTVANATYATSAGVASSANSVAGANVSGQVGNALVAGTVYTASQPNITSVGTLTNLYVSNGSATANVYGNGAITVSGNITAANFIGNVVGNISGNIVIPGSNTGVVFNDDGNANTSTAFTFNKSSNLLTVGGNIVGDNVYANSGTIKGNLLTGTLTTAAQPNVTSVGTLTGLNVNGELVVTSGNANIVDLNAANAHFSGVVNVTNTTNSTGTGTGAFTVAGGASITNDLWVGGTIHAPNLDITTYNQLEVDVPLLYLASNVTFPYSYDLGIFSHFQTQAGSQTAANGYQHSGFVRNHSDNAWYLFSNVFTEPSGGTVDLSNADIKFDAIKVGNIISSGTANITGNITVANANLGNLATSNYFSGNGSLLTAIAGANVTGTVGNATHATVADSANSVAGANVTGTVANATYATSAGTASTANSVAGANVSGDVSGANHANVADSANSVAGANVTGTVANATYATSAGVASSANAVAGANVTGQVGNALVAGTVYTAAQPNITSVGTLTSLTVSGTTNLGAVGNITITGGSSGYYLQTNGSGTLVWAAVPTGTGISNGTSNVNVPTLNGNVTIGVGGVANTATFTTTGVNVAGYLTANGNLTVANANLGNLATANYFSGDGSLLTALTGANVTGTVANATNAAHATVADSANSVAGANVSGAVTSATSATTAGTVTTASQPNITSVGTLTSLAVSTNATVGNVKITGAILSNRASVSVSSSSNTIIDQFPSGTYRSAKYVVTAQGTNGYQSAEVLMVQDGADAYITIYGSICSNNTADIVEFGSNVDGGTGNAILYAKASGAATTVNLISMYLAD